jgi:uncharacterized membrane protein YfcA
MCFGSLVGGYVAARTAQRIDQRLIKAVVTLIGLVLTIFFFWRGA